MGEKLAASVIEEKVGSPKGTKRLIRPQGGRPMPITPGPSRQSTEKSPMLTTTDMVKVQNNTGLSNNKIRGLASTLNKSFGARLVEPNFREDFASVGKKLEAFFTTTTVCDSSKKDNSGTKVVHCISLSEFVAMVSEERGISKSSTITKIGIDGGGNFLKFSLSIIDTKRSPMQGAGQKATSLTASKSLDSGVKKQLIVAIAENLPENYENLKAIFSLLGQVGSPFFVACDMKVANILCGIQSHSSSHPCCWCDITSDNLQSKGKPRTIESIRTQFQLYTAHSRGNKLQAKKFLNVIHEPLIQAEETSKTVLELIPPMELHLLLGMVNHLYKGLQKIWEGVSEWPATLHLNMQAYHGGEFAGNDCKKLLNNIDLLSELATKHRIAPAKGFVKAFEHFRRVVHSCFGNNLSADFEIHIKAFQECYLTLPVTVTPKAHAVFHHVSEFVKLHNSGLGQFSEQSTEALHSVFSSHWARYKRSLDNPNYGKQLFNCVLDYNCKHL
jgi:hypothetical protein